MKVHRNWLKIERIKNDMSQQEVAELVETTRQYISQIENGLSNPSGRLAYKIATALEFDVSLFYEDGNDSA